jgi:hypothetical protein
VDVVEAAAHAGGTTEALKCAEDTEAVW